MNIDGNEIAPDQIAAVTKFWVNMSGYTSVKAGFDIMLKSGQTIRVSRSRSADSDSSMKIGSEEIIRDLKPLREQVIEAMP